MSTPSIERCPRCGSPYMSAMLPNETPATRYCYTCATAAGSLKERLGKPIDSDPSDLELQPTAPTASVSSRRSGPPQFTSSRRIVPNRQPTAAPNVRPKSRSSAAIPPPPPQQAADADTQEPSPEEQAGAAARVAAITNANIRVPSRRRSSVRQMAPTAARFPEPKPAFPMKLIVSIAACAILAIVAVFALKSNKTAPSPAPDTTVAMVAPTPAPLSKTTSVPANSSVVIVTKPAAQAVKPQATKSSDTTDNRIGLAKPDSRPESQTGALTGEADQPKIAAKTSNVDVSDILAKPSSKRTATGLEEEEVPAIKIAASKPAVALPTPPAEPKPAEPGEAKDTPVIGEAPGEMAGGKDDLDKDGKPKKHRSLIENLSAEPEKPVKHEMEKKENPFAVKVIPVTATEPAIMPYDIEKVAGNDRFLTDQVIAFLPNWRVRDANYNGSKINFTHQGRDNVIQLNPVNDVLPAKLMATFEIPKSFANAHPTLRFEISTAPRKDWMFSVKANGVDLISRTPIKLAKETPWQDVVIDLTPLADKHFDLQIEVSAVKKWPKGTVPDVGFIRNVRFEWKKK